MSLYTLAITTPASLSPPILEGVGFNSPVMEKAITNGSGTGGDGPAITNDLNPTVSKTVGDGV